MSFTVEDVRIYRPWRDGVPRSLFEAAGCNPQSFDPDWVRVARLDETTIGAYALEPRSPTVFVLRTLVVARPWRGRGLGRWLLGHAIALGESKGARTIEVECAPATRLLERAGFDSCATGSGATGLRFTLEPD